MKKAMFYNVSIMMLLGVLSLTGCGTANTIPTDRAVHSLGSYSFKFNKFLPFMPLLPKYTAGYSIIRTKIERSLNNPIGNTIIYTAIYGNSPTDVGFVIDEARPNEMHFVSEPWKSGPMIGNIRSKMYKHDGGENILFIKNGVEYVVTSIQGTVSMTELEKVCASISEPASVMPTEINIEINGSATVKELGFYVERTGEFYVPKGFELAGEGGDVNIQGNKKIGTYQLNYNKGTAFLTITQQDGFYFTVTGNPNYINKKIDRVDVDLKTFGRPGQIPSAVFAPLHSQIQFTISTDLSLQEVEKITKSILTNYRP